MVSLNKDLASYPDDDKSLAIYEAKYRSSQHSI